MAIPQSGYIGILSLNGKKIRCTSFSINPNQTSLFYNHVIGLNDTVPNGDGTKGEAVGIIQTQRRIWRPSTVSISGSISFPATKDNIKAIFDYAKYGNYFDITFNYYCKEGKTFKYCRINGFELSVQSGDIVNISLDIVCKDIGDSTVEMTYNDAEKLITWDKVSVTGSGFDSNGINGFSFKINNNAMPIYISQDPSSTDSTGLKPFDLRLGMQEVTGSIMVYLKAGEEFIDANGLVPITVTVDTWSTTINAVFQSNRMDGLVGPVMTELPFVGVDKAFGA